jgi:RimJ/RimL family protein N-acetyltransferase
MRTLHSSHLETARLVLRQPLEADLDGWAAFDSDAEASKFFGGPKNRAASWEMMASAAGMWALRECGLFSVLEKGSGRWIGRVGPWKPEGATAEVGWAILPSEWGKGYAHEAAGAAIDWVINSLGWTQINHCIDADNIASIRLAEKLGSLWIRSELDANGKPTQVYGQTSGKWNSRGR